MDIRHLHYFTVVAQEKNISRAAKRLHITQPALSRQIHALEQRLGVTLLERRGRGIRLTRTAEELLPRCAEVVARARGLEDFAAEIGTIRSIEIRIGATAHFFESLVAPVIKGFRRRHPDVDLVFIEQASSSLERLLVNNEADLVLGAHRLVGTFSSRILPPVPLTAWATSHRFAAQETLELADLAQEPLLVLKRGFITREVFESACQLAGLNPTIRHESESVHTLLRLAEAGLGVAIVQSNANMRVPSTHLMREGEPLLIKLAAAWNPHTHVPAAATKLVDEVEQVMASKSFPNG